MGKNNPAAATAPVAAPAAEPDFDILIIGAGVAGCVAAIELAKADFSVAIIERGEIAGAKNLSGGIFYSRIMEEVLPNFLQEAPIERIITKNVLSFLNKESAVNINYWDNRLANPVNAVSVLRAKLDAWLAEEAEELGAMVMPGVKVDELLVEDGQVCGIRAGEEEVRAHITILADGVNSFLAQAAGIRQKAPNKTLAVGVKSVIEIGESTIQERFALGEIAKEEASGATVNLPLGAAFALVGEATQGVAGGAFLYTNKDSISLGVVLRLDDLVKKGLAAADIHNSFLQHPFIAPYIAGGKELEYGCHLTIEDGPALSEQKLYAPGLLIVGDAGGFTLNTGMTIRGMDLAAESARCAARAAKEALEIQDFSESALRSYRRHLRESWIGKDLETYKKAPAFFDNDRLYNAYGEMLGNIFFDLYRMDLQPRRALRKVALANLKKSGIKMCTLIQDAMRALRSL